MCARETLLFCASVHPWVHCRSICPSCYLLNHWTEFNQTCYITSPYGKGVREQQYFSVQPPSVHLSITLSPKPVDGIQSNSLHHFPHMVRLCESNIIFPCIHYPSICPSNYLVLNHWAEFNQTCYMTSPHGKSVQEPVSLSPVRQSCYKQH